MGLYSEQWLERLTATEEELTQAMPRTNTLQKTVSEAMA